jgi:hypothetical protein
MSAWSSFEPPKPLVVRIAGAGVAFVAESGL